MTKRAGRTVKLSISIDQSDLELLQKRAKRLSGGNISAAITEMIHIAKEHEGRATLAAWLGEGREEPSQKTMDAVRAEWLAGSLVASSTKPRAKRPKRRTRAA